VLQLTSHSELRSRRGTVWRRTHSLGRAAEALWLAAERHIRWAARMQFAKRLRPLVQSGEVTCSVRIWQQPRVKLGGRYALPPGQIEVTSIREISPNQITPRLARRSGFESVEELLRVAQHGRGEFIFLVEFVYHAS
jgi:hypothetical protein